MIYSAPQQHCNEYRYYPVRLQPKIPDAATFIVPRLLMTFGDSATDKKMKLIKDWPVKDMMLDSGAFTQRGAKGEIKIREYINFLHKHKDHFTCYVNFDKIYDPEQTEKNQRLMESEGLNPIPVWHTKSDIKLLVEMMQEYSHLCIGGIRPLGPDERMQKLYQIFDHWRPGIRIHLLGIATPDILSRFPVWSSDSRSATFSAAVNSEFCVFNPAERKIERWSTRDTLKTWAHRKLLLLHGLDIHSLPKNETVAATFSPYLLKAALRSGTVLERCIRADRAALGTEYRDK